MEKQFIYLLQEPCSRTEDTISLGLYIVRKNFLKEILYSSCFSFRFRLYAVSLSGMGKLKTMVVM